MAIDLVRRERHDQLEELSRLRIGAFLHAQHAEVRDRGHIARLQTQGLLVQRLRIRPAVGRFVRAGQLDERVQVVRVAGQRDLQIVDGILDLTGRAQDPGELDVGFDPARVDLERAAHGLIRLGEGFGPLGLRYT